MAVSQAIKGGLNGRSTHLGVTGGIVYGRTCPSHITGTMWMIFKHWFRYTDGVMYVKWQYGQWEIHGLCMAHAQLMRVDLATVRSNKSRYLIHWPCTYSQPVPVIFQIIFRSFCEHLPDTKQWWKGGQRGSIALCFFVKKVWNRCGIVYSIGSGKIIDYYMYI